ncbi:MAG TPA: PA0069 family radical SAM protein [Gammaproteobacteria bacterium]|nr:PA0069 family radical SAM protein [Gammaproteobacteria bacterium]
MKVIPVRKGRGAGSQPDPRYLSATREVFDDGWGTADESAPPLSTKVTEECARTIVSHNDSPDIPFRSSINPYRGCEHGCIYCYARPTHAYLDLSPGLDFESRLFAKTNAAELLRRELAKPGHRVSAMALGANTDPYQPMERKYKITRAIIEVLYECGHPFTIITKSALVERDIDLLAPLAARRLVEVYVSVTTLDRQLARRMEPRATAPQRRIETLGALRAAGIPAGVMFAPVIPALNDQDMEKVLESAHAAGALYAGYVMLGLPYEIKDLFREWLRRHYPLRAEHVLNVIRDLRGGRENDPRFGSRMRGEGHFAELIARRFAAACRKLGLNRPERALDTTQFRPPSINGQLSLI